jgi:hypothetical protein
VVPLIGRDSTACGHKSSAAYAPSGAVVNQTESPSSPEEPKAAELTTVRREVGETIERHRGTHIGEQNTKLALINPVLRTLGWDVEDLEDVRHEFKLVPADKPVDYALMLARSPRLFVEAKGLDEDLQDRRWAHQIISHATFAGVEWVVLTNGVVARVLAERLGLSKPSMSLDVYSHTFGPERSRRRRPSGAGDSVKMSSPVWSRASDVPQSGYLSKESVWMEGKRSI